ncbi:uncharacterized protein TNCV_1013871 [Trichonephila clavipes]|uniref:Uncharacterized protein n=1 Tax=Trichonephila clavipes TaxID=2585209 RepID=A0A8X6VXF3_TRICX|nr:uncharacterized protein TNCV_1013871 [Trichonephila clavipes]
MPKHKLSQRTVQGHSYHRINDTGSPRYRSPNMRPGLSHYFTPYNQDFPHRKLVVVVVSSPKGRNEVFQNLGQVGLLQYRWRHHLSLSPAQVFWLATLTAVPLGLGSNPGEDMDVCKCIVPLRHGATLNSRRAASPLVCLLEGVERWEAPDHSQMSSLKIGVETSQIVLSPDWCSKLRLTTGVT